MTNNEAITLLRTLEDKLDSYCELNEEGKTAFRMAIEALSSSEIPNSSDTISRQAAIDALLKALYEYEDKTEKQFQESDELDVGDWILHRVFVQNMSDIDRRTILDLPSTEPEIDKQELVRTITAGIIATSTKDVYSCGMRNGMRWCRALLEEDAPTFEDASLYAQLEIVRCKDCKHADEYFHCSYTPWWNRPDDFCSRAERREE